MTPAALPSPRPPPATLPSPRPQATQRAIEEEEVLRKQAKPRGNARGTAPPARLTRRWGAHQ